MTELAIVCNDITPLAQYLRGRLGQLPDQELLASTRRLVGASNQILAELLAHLAEVEARGVHRLRLCTSLYAYCIYELQFSEDAAFRRVSAARLLQKFPTLYDVIASGELHLTGLLQVGPHLTQENFSEVLARAKHRTKKEIAKLVRELDPLPDVPARIEPLGPVLPQQIKMRNPTWSEYLLMLNPVNHLLPGQRPRDWMSDTPFALVPRPNEPQSVESEAPSNQCRAENGDEHASDEIAIRERDNDQCASDRHDNDQHDSDQLARNGRASEFPSNEGGERSATSEQVIENRDGALTAPQRFAVQFTATEEYVDLVARAQALLSHGPKMDLGELHLRAMKVLVTELERKKFATTKRRSSQVSSARRATTDVAEKIDETEAERVQDAEGTGPEGAKEAEVSTFDDDSGESSRRQRGRAIPAAVRRAVYERDGLRCTHVDDSGARCAVTHRLQFHHARAFGRGGEHTVANLTLRCMTHNDLAAELDFGTEKMRAAKDRTRQESLIRQSVRD